MSTIISGSLRLSNGQSPSLCIDVPRIEIPQEDSTQWISSCKILGGSLLIEFIEFTEKLPEKDIPIDELLRVAKHIVDGLILSQVAVEGIGLSYSLDFYKTCTGEVLSVPFDFISQLESISFRAEDVSNLLGIIPELRYAIRDFNQGLLDRENCPFLFHRTTETLAKLICNREELSKKDWDNFYRKLGVNKTEITNLEILEMKEKITHPHRHGNHVFFSKEEHLKMLRNVRLILSRTIQLIINQQEFT